MKKTLLLALSYLVWAGQLPAQLIQSGGKVYYDSTQVLSKVAGQQPTVQNGSGSLGQIYNNSACGLNYVQTSVMLTTRYSPPGLGLPATISMSGVPCTAQVLQAYIWWTTSGSALTGSVTITNPSGGTAVIAATLAGSGPAKCWAEVGTRTFRADVTSMVTGNGNYTFNLSNGATEADGATMMIIYRDLTATYRGSLVLNDGCIVNNSGGSVSQTMTGINACGPSTAARAFVIASDLQPNAAANHTTTLNGLNYTMPSTFWNYDVTNTTVLAGQNNATFGISTSSDCYAMAVMGLYFQTLTCVTCTPSSALSVSPSQTNVTCYGGSNGSATVSVTGGGSPYTYSWSPSGGTGATASGLAAGSYTCYITDVTGCNTTSQSFTITQPPAITASQSQTNVTCNGGSNATATVSASGGTGALTYTWSPSGGNGSTATGLSQGSYTCTISDANGCSVTRSFTITEPGALTATTSQTNVTCNGGTNGSATVSASGGTGTYTYAWSPSGGTAATASNLGQGSYTCTITDANGCSITRSFTITQPTALTASQSQVNVSCGGNNDGSATVTASGGTGALTYSWSPSGGSSSTASGLGQGSYTCTITDANGCSITRSFTITENSPITVTQSQTNVTCNGGTTGSATVSASGGVGSLTYSWSPVTGTTSSISGIGQGTYVCTITDANGCFVTSTFNITEPAALTSTESQTNVTCNNGTNGTATVSVSGGTGTYTYSWSPSGGTGATATGLAQGSYNCTITDANGCSITRSFTITQPAALTSTQSQTNLTCNGSTDGTATVTASGGTGTLTYSWSPSGGTSSTASGLSQGSYVCTVTDANGCSITANFTLTEPPAIVLTQSQTNLTCNSAANGTATVTASGGTGTLTYSWSPTGGNGTTATGLSQGNYTCTITDATGCTATATFTITEPAAFNVTFTTTGSTCSASDGSATANVTGGTGSYTYSWSTGGTAATETGLAAGVYNVTVTDANGCDTTQNVTVNSVGAVLVVTPAQINLTCNSSNDGAASVAVTGGAPAYTYSWSTSAVNNDTVTGLAAGIHNCTITDQNGCSVSHSFTITEPAALTTSYAQTNVSCNAAADGTIKATVTGGTASYTYSWSTTATTDSISNLGAGTYTCEITDANGCSVIDNITITEPQVLASINSQTNVSCNGMNDGTATLQVTGGTGAYTYVWGHSGDTTAFVDSLSAGTYTCTVTDSNNCVIVNSFTITEPPVLAITLASTNALCFGAADGTADVTVTGGTPAYTYSWMPSGGTSPSATGLIAGTYTVLVADANACFVIDSVIITEPPAITAVTSKTDVTCSTICNGTVTAQASGGSGTLTYLWTPGNFTTQTISNQCTGIYTCEIRDSLNCSIQVTDTIIQLPTVSATISTSANVSCNAGADGSATVAVTGGLGGTYTYLWTPGAFTTASASNLSAGTYSVIAEDSIGCRDTVEVIITEPNALTALVTGDTLVCSGANAQLSSTVTGGTTPYTYLWSDGTTGNNANVVPTATTSYSVLVTDAYGCFIQSQNFTVDIPAPLVAVMSLADSLCPGESAELMATVTGGMMPYAYSWNNGAGTNPGPVVVTPGSTTNYICNISDMCTTALTDSVEIVVHPQPVASISIGTTTANIGVPVQFTCTGSNATQWFWDFGDDFSSDKENPLHTYMIDGEYKIYLEVTSAAGCKDTVTYSFLNVIQETGIPNVFSPNGDGQNDVFYIRNSEVELFEINIFDRWGKVIFNSSTPFVYWDGYTGTGLQCSDGTYYYVLRSTLKTGEATTITGFVTLVR